MPLVLCFGVALLSRLSYRDAQPVNQADSLRLPLISNVGRLLKPPRILLGWRLRHVWQPGGGRFVLRNNHLMRCLFNQSHEGSGVLA